MDNRSESRDPRISEKLTVGTEVINTGGVLVGSLFYIPSVLHSTFIIALVRPLVRVSRLCSSCIGALSSVHCAPHTLPFRTSQEESYRNIVRRSSAFRTTRTSFEKATGVEVQTKKMPETSHHMNGFANGHTAPELQQDTTFLFTSESVGEGHPGI